MVIPEVAWELHGSSGKLIFPNRAGYLNRDVCCTSRVLNRPTYLNLIQAGDIYRAGRMYGLMPIMAEVYNLGEPAYYAVAVVKIR